MSIFKSAGTGASEAIKLEGNNNYLPWYNSIKRISQVGYGIVGLNVLEKADIQMDTNHPGKKPSELDERTNPVTQQPVKGSLLYTRESVFTDENVNDGASMGNSLKTIFDMPLKTESQTRFNNDTKTFNAQLEKLKAEEKTNRTFDDALLITIQGTISIAVQSTIETHADHKTFSTRPSNYFYRSKDYLAMVASLYSTGNARLIAANVRRSFIYPQGDTPFAEWLTNWDGNWNFAAKCVEDKDQPGTVKLSTLKFLFMSCNLNMDHPANIAATNNYYLSNKFEMKPELLVAELIAQNIALFTPADPTSQQGSALKASAPPAIVSNWGERDPARNDHCKSCVALTKGKEKTVKGGITRKGPFYFYNHSSDNCNRKEGADAKAKAKALMAAAAPVPPATAPPSNSDITNAINAHLAQLYANADNQSMMSCSTQPN